MSLVGRGSFIKSEWEGYNLKHRSWERMKTGITGMWKERGRNEVTDFDEVVRLDQEYLEN